MSAHYIGGEVKETKRYKLGQLAGSVARHFLLMTATPHNGNDEDFQLFWPCSTPIASKAARETARTPRYVATSCAGWSRRSCCKFDGTPLFPERRAYSVDLPALRREALLYKRVTEYVQRRDEPRRAAQAEGEGRRGASSASRSQSSSAAWPPRPRRSTSRSPPPRAA